MKSKPLSFVLFAIPVVTVAALTVAAIRPNPASMTSAPDPTCSSPAPCIQYQNTGSGPAIRGIGGTGNGVAGEATVSSRLIGRAGVIGADISTTPGYFNNWGVKGTSINGIGVEGDSTNWVGANVVGGFYGSIPGGPLYPPVSYPALSVVGDADADSLIDACAGGGQGPCAAKGSMFDVDSAGDITITGEIHTGGSCSTGCAVHNSVREAVRFYTPRESLPTVEDFGEAQLTAGRAYVRIDPAFADTMDRHANYIVSITPEGPSRGLYVTAKTLAGFEVLENPGGRATLPFSYRIVAKPYGEDAPRLQRFAIHVSTASRMPQ